jgi:hypothetical protein
VGGVSARLNSAPTILNLLMLLIFPACPGVHAC